MKSQELFALLQRDRRAEKTSTRQQIAYRMQAEGVLGQDENLYKIEYVRAIFICRPRSLSAAPQKRRHQHPIAGSRGLDRRRRGDCAREVATVHRVLRLGKCFCLLRARLTLQTHPTEGLPQRIDQPFLHRSVVVVKEVAFNIALTFQESRRARKWEDSWRIHDQIRTGD